MRIAVLLGAMLVLIPSLLPVSASTGPVLGPRILYMLDNGLLHGSFLLYVELGGRGRADSLLSLGFSPTSPSGFLHLGNLYVVESDPAALQRALSDDRIARIEYAKPILPVPDLDISVPEIGAPEVWSRGYDGSGTLIADLDTGVDYDHPFLFRYNGPKYDLVDTNGNGLPDPGVDYVDLNGNGRGDRGEGLGLIEDSSGQVTTPTFGHYDWGYDFLFNDRNSNGVLDRGEELLLWDGSKLVSQGGRVVEGVAVKQGGLIRVFRGDEIEDAPKDVIGHGTGVAGILAGGGPGLRYQGVAHGASILSVVVHGPYSMSIVEGIAVAVNEGADVILIEVGSWVFEFLDGSSPEEQAVDAAVDEGIPVVVPAGNLYKEKHAYMLLQGGGRFEFTLERGARTVYLTVLWRSGERPTFYLGSGGQELRLPCDGSTVEFRGHRVYSRIPPPSPRGTRMLMVTISRDEGVERTGWYLRVEGGHGGYHAYLADDNSTWEPNARFTKDFENFTSTVVSPSTADGAFSVGSYSTRGFYVPGPGALSPWSGRGPRIDGAQKPDIAAPGNYDIITSSLGGLFEYFGGTSASAPHAAASIALLREAYPNATVDDLYGALRERARTDSWTGETPNYDWGFGKLNVSSAYDLLDVYPPDLASFSYNLSGTEISFRVVAKDHHQVHGNVSIDGISCQLYDDGMHNDGLPGDNVLGGSVDVDGLSGVFNVTVSLEDSLGNRGNYNAGAIVLPGVPEGFLGIGVILLLLYKRLKDKRGGKGNK